MKLALVVDDDSTLRRLLDFTLRNAGFTVLLAPDGERGLALALEHHPDIAILDVMMPGMHGYDLCRRLRENPSTAHVKIIFLTARSQSIDEQAALSAGADLFLSKPVLPNNLIEHMRSLLEETSVPEPEPAAAHAETQPQLAEKGRLVACFCPVPGAGVTMLSVNLALAFAVSLKTKVPLIELHGTQEGILQTLGFEADPQRGNLAAAGQDLSWDTLQTHLAVHPSGVYVLPASPPDSGTPPTMTGEAVTMLRDRFSIAVADTAAELDERVKPVLLTADLILLVTTPEVSVIRAMLGALQELRTLQFPDRRILVVVNQVQPQAGVPVDQLAEGIKRPIFAVIPHEPDAATLLRSGRPLLAVKPRSPTSQAIGRITMQLARGFKLSKNG